MHQDATWYGGRPRPTRVSFGLRDIVFDVDRAAPRKKAHPAHPIFGPCLLWPNGWMDEDAAWYGSRPRPRPHCIRWGPSSRERGTAAPSFWPMSIVATVAYLNYYELLFVFSFFIILFFVWFRAADLSGYSSAFRRTLIYSIVSYRIVYTMTLHM